MPLNLCDWLFSSISVPCYTVNVPLRGGWRQSTSLPKPIPFSLEK